MRIRLWAALATALVTAALVDWSSELLSNAGWLGAGAAPDVHQESVLPVALAAVLVLLGLAVTIALRAGRGDRAHYEAVSTGRRIALAALTLVATFAVIVLMEASETRFGGLFAFDPRSVLAVHVPAVLAAYAIVAVAVGWLVARCLPIAGVAGALVAHALAQFFATGVRGTAPMHRHAAPGARLVPRRPVALFGARSQRAPPVVQFSLANQLLD